MKKKRLICFDLDNTLIHSDKAHIAAYHLAFKKNGLKKVNERLLKKKFGRVGKLIVRELFPSLSNTKINKVIKDHHYFLIKKTYKFAKPIAGAKNVLKQLRKNFKLAIVTNCSSETLKVLMKSTDIKKEWFSVVIGHDNVLHPKPAPDEILKAEKLLHLDADFMVGDTPFDIIAGKKSKTKVISVLTGNHSRAMLQKKKPFKIIKSVKDLLKVIQ
tara:strand:- start:2065 stop:2709 length:645 start_codon:yes stop_codon:yes gene_type:complete